MDEIILLHPVRSASFLFTSLVIYAPVLAMSYVGVLVVAPFRLLVSSSGNHTVINRTGPGVRHQQSPGFKKFLTLSMIMPHSVLCQVERNSGWYDAFRLLLIDISHLGMIYFQ